VKFYGAKKTKTSASWWQRSRKCYYYMIASEVFIILQEPIQGRIGNADKVLLYAVFYN
jgi:hypothetical protein